MRAEVVNTFVLAAAEVLAAETSVRAKRGPLSLEREAYVSDEVTVLISLVGDVWGIVFYSMSLETARAVLSTMLGQQLGAFDELAQSGIAELANVIAGQASTRLAELGSLTQVSVPTLIVGKGSRISTLDIERLVVPLETELGAIRLDLALRDAPPGSVHRRAGSSHYGPPGGERANPPVGPLWG
jgi:chemotaxis protein CheX